MQPEQTEGRNLTSKTTRKRPLARARRRWEDNIRMDLKEIGTNTRNWVDYIGESFVNASLNLWVP